MFKIEFIYKILYIYVFFKRLPYTNEISDKQIKKKAAN